MSAANCIWARMRAVALGALLAASAIVAPATATADDIVYLEGVTTSSETSGAQANFARLSDEDRATCVRL